MTDSAVTSQDVAHRAAPPKPPREMTVAEVEAELERLAGLSNMPMSANRKRWQSA